MELKEFYKSEKVKWALIVLVVLVLILLAFQAGTVVGTRRADFSDRFGDNYSRIFEGRRSGFQSMMGARPVQGDGVTGTVVAASGGTITVASSDKTEKMVHVTSDTLIRRFRGDASTSDITLGDNVIVIGEPGTDGEINARLIRIVPQASSTAANY